MAWQWVEGKHNFVCFCSDTVGESSAFDLHKQGSKASLDTSADRGDIS